jgi:uncharacterized membrane protein YphA (DoxX/SURF4 family)
MSAAARPAAGDVLPPAGLLAKGLAGLRIFFGLIFFLNGLAKLFSFRTIEIGPYSSFLINREETRQILDFEVNQRNGGTDVPLLPTLSNDVILPNFGFFQWVITAVELGVGAALIFGLATRGAALIGFGQQIFLQLVYLSSTRWMFEQPHEWVPLLILALVPAGRMWGVDGRLVRKRPQLRRWPF